MATSDTTIEKRKFQLSDNATLYWGGIHFCFLAVYLAMIFWGMGLKNYVDSKMQQEIGLGLFHLLVIFTILSARETIPLLVLIVREFHYEFYVWPKEHDRWFEERMRIEAEERKQKFLAELKKKDERRRKKQKPVGEPVNLKEWIGERYIRRGGYIYIIKDTEISGYYKIGKTTQPYERMKAFGVLLPFAVELIHVIQCDNANRVEAHLHQHYISKRQRGEWFNLTDEDIAELKLIHEWKAAQ